MSTIRRPGAIRRPDRLRDGVRGALELLGRGFLRHPANRALHTALHSGALDPQEYFRHLLRLVYRLLCWGAAEARGLLPDPVATAVAHQRYHQDHSLHGLRDRAARLPDGPAPDLWPSLRLVLTGFGEGCPDLGLPAWGSLFRDPPAMVWLIQAELANEELLAALHALDLLPEEGCDAPGCWPELGAEQLGRVHESLQELHPRLNREAGTFELCPATGHARKTSGSYYTPRELVDCLLDSALEPLLAEAGRQPDPAQALLALRVCDPACGAGLFLVAAARRIARQLAAVRADDHEPRPAAFRTALRDVIGRCIFGVDLDPLAVELARLSLWLEVAEPGLPLAVLEGHLRTGDALFGATPARLEQGIPDEAWARLEGDDPAVARRLRQRNRKARSAVCDRRSGPEPAETTAPTSRSGTGADLQPQLLADTWAAAFVWPKTPGEAEQAAPTHDRWDALVREPGARPAATGRIVRELADRHSFLHWHLAFPEVFNPGGGGGFDCLLGNPPWERAKFQEKEYLTASQPEIAGASTAARRGQLLQRLRQADPRACRDLAATLRDHQGRLCFLRHSGIFPQSGRGDVNLYALFAERATQLLRPQGYLGLVLPSGIMTDLTTSSLFRQLLAEGRLISTFHFDNRGGLFGDVGSMITFCLFTVGPRLAGRRAKTAFFCRSADDLQNPDRCLELGHDDLLLLNPQSLTCPVFRTRRDFELTRNIQQRFPVFSSAAAGWQPRLMTLFHMTQDSRLFLEPTGADEVSRATDAVPLYEGRMIHHFDHRWFSYAGQPIDKADPTQLVTPRFLVSRSVVAARLGRLPAGVKLPGFCLVWRDICRSTDERTVIATLIPQVAVNNKLPLILLQDGTAREYCVLLAILSSFLFDYLARQKLGGATLNFFILRQLPIVPRTLAVRDFRIGRQPFGDFIVKRALELLYTAGDLQPLAQACDWTGPPFQWNPSRRELLRGELDAALFLLYGLDRDEAAYILDTFPLVRRNEERRWGEFRSKRLILERYDAMRRAAATNEEYATPLDPPPADRRAAHPG